MEAGRSQAQNGWKRGEVKHKERGKLSAWQLETGTLTWRKHVKSPPEEPGALLKRETEHLWTRRQRPCHV